MGVTLNTKGNLALLLKVVNGRDHSLKNEFKSPWSPPRLLLIYRRKSQSVANEPSNPDGVSHLVSGKRRRN